MMDITAQTKLIGRFHKEPSARGLNIYNPFFQEAGINAVYLLFHNSDPRMLMNGFRSLNLSGAITAGFESDTVLPTLLDSLDEVTQYVGKIGYLTGDAGQVTGHYQNGKAMLRTIQNITDPAGKKIVLVGAGVVAQALIFEMEKEGIQSEIDVFNRDLAKAQKLNERFRLVKHANSLDKLEKSSGDVFVNLTNIGGSVTDITFPSELVSKFVDVVDVTFEKEETDLVTTARSLNKNVATGWDMFTYQAQVCVEGLLGIHADFAVLKKHVVRGLSETVK